MSEKAIKRLEVVLIFLSVFAWLGFFMSLGMYRADYVNPIDPVDSGYTPFASKHAFL
jgi:hypothetical protein